MHNRNLVIAVTGHRVVPDPDAVTAAMERALDHSVDAFGAPRFTLLSALAEGADRLAAELALRRPDGVLVAVLPFPESEYLRTFRSAASRREYARLRNRAARVLTLPRTASPEEAYVALGKWLVARSTLLLAVWDGEPGHGSGGTADVVARARKRRHAVAWIRTATDASAYPGTPSPSAADLIRYERFPNAPALGGESA